MFSLIEQEMENKSITENGAIGYESSKSALLDLNYQVSSLRSSEESEIIRLFDVAYHENPEYAVKWLFFARDVRGGLGERRLFRICYKRLVELDVNVFSKNLMYICEYGRWDDLISLLGISEITDKMVMQIVKMQLVKDLNNIKDNKPISLLGKWLPSENASSIKTKKLAKKVMKSLELSPRKYRLLLSKLRKYSNVVEVKMCDNKWSEIDYNKVPSLANLKYEHAFMKHDGDRRTSYLESVKKGKSKMNMSVATPVDIVHRYNAHRGRYYAKVEENDTLELAWKNLKDMPLKNTLVVADGSGSMYAPVSGRTLAIEVANALAIYTSEHNSEVYKDKYITFSNKPQFVDLSGESTLLGKINVCMEHNEIANTNIEAVFDLILGIALIYNVPSDDMIDRVLIISDMEFDDAQKGGYWRSRSDNLLTKPLFETIKDRFNDNGYNLPKLIFWNVNSRTKTIPLLENELGVTLVSGFSQNVLKMVMSNKYDPYEVLVETITSKRYERIRI